MQRYGVLNRDKMNYFITVLKSVILFILFFFRGFFFTTTRPSLPHSFFSLCCQRRKEAKEKPKNVLSSWAARQVLGRLK
jgi:hypothetical protein